MPTCSLYNDVFFSSVFIYSTPKPQGDYFFFFTHTTSAFSLTMMSSFPRLNFNDNTRPSACIICVSDGVRPDVYWVMLFELQCDSCN